MPVYAEGFRHQRDCPYDAVEKARAKETIPLGDGVPERFDSDSVFSQEGDLQAEEQQEEETKKICADPHCRTWFDLANWFGFLPLELPPADFEACFTDVAHGGAG